MSTGFPTIVRVLPLLVVLVCAGCNKPHRTASMSPTPAQRSPTNQMVPFQPESRIPPCSLITNQEVGAIQHATISDAKSSAGISGGMLMSQCYYTAKEPNMSVSLAVIQPSGEGTARSAAKDYWGKTIRGSSEQSGGETQREDRDQKSERGEEEEKKNPPKKIDGVGDEAYWSGSRFGGALYVLKRDAFIRISVGGPDNEATKIEKSKGLAEKALPRLP